MCAEVNTVVLVPRILNPPDRELPGSLFSRRPLPGASGHECHNDREPVVSASCCVLVSVSPPSIRPGGEHSRKHDHHLKGTVFCVECGRLPRRRTHPDPHRTQRSLRQHHLPRKQLKPPSRTASQAVNALLIRATGWS